MATAFDLKTASSVKSAFATLATQQQLNGVKSPTALNEKARQASQEFEAVYLNTMFSQMFTGIDGDGIGICRLSARLGCPSLRILDRVGGDGNARQRNLGGFRGSLDRGRGCRDRIGQGDALAVCGVG